MSRAARVLPVACAAVVLTALASGCGGSTAGSPVPGNTGFDTTVTGSSPPSTPARPRELRLDGEDPCALVPESDWAYFYIEGPGKPKTDPTFNAPKCFYSNSIGGFGVMLVTTEGVEAWTGGQRSGRPGDISPVVGFPAITVTLPNDDNQCDVAVDVAEGQYLLANIRVDDDKLSEVPQICEYAHQLAVSAMRTLVR